MNGATLYLVNRMERESDEIARGLRRRDPDLLDSLIEQYQHRLLRYLISLVHERQTAEDIFQETWIRVLEQGHRYDPRHNFVTWLLTIARNLAIDHMRRKRPDAIEDLPPTAEPAVRGPGALEIAQQHQQAERLDGALQHIPGEQREAILLRFQEGMSLEEIAKVTKSPLSTVKSRLYRGLEAMAGLVKEVRP
jgi:RNA polymerase sigma-70 factor (ECF subfamily)